ncbi:hypothetical protein JW930_05560 [Candidatus Woesearchaeota archaeon]|nr:hypothetical protein [Candidatus Woesearchaeota archaeon]
MTKKAMSQYLSWILLILFAVGLSSFMLVWTRNYVKGQSDDLTSRADNAMCDDVSLNLDGYCQNSQTLNMNITNTNLLTIAYLRLRFIDLYDNIADKKIEADISPGDTERITVLKQGTLRQVRVVPVMINDKKEIICNGKGVSLEEIKQC